MPKNKSLVRQVQEALQSKLKIGESKHLAKQEGLMHEGIYSWGTYKTYRDKGVAFVRQVKEYQAGMVGGDSNSTRSSKVNSKNLAGCRKYVNIYPQDRIDKGYSPSTQKTIASALAKLYGCSTMDFIKTQVRHRRDITRSRIDKETGEKRAKFSEARNVVRFGRAYNLN